MSTEVDQRVVSLQVDNKDFEQGVQQTLKSLTQLDDSINKLGSQNTNSFNGLISALNTVDTKISNGILPTMEAVNSKFSFFGTIADQTIRNMTNSVQGFIHRTLDGLFQVRGGMNEYELKMGSVQTILNSTGESLDTVTQKLDDLNTYSDKTIYSFKDMTDNIGKFTNQGVKLDKSVAAIKGIANEAALSGASAAQASHAMYNFAQALSTGYVGLLDWKSIENAMMATTGFKDALLETATALGTVTKQGNKYITTTVNANGKVSELFDTQTGFRDSLNHRWITSDVLTQTLELYATNVEELNDAEREEYETKLKSLGFTDEQIKKFEELGIKAAKAATEVKTFSMLVDTVVEAIGSGWAKTFEIIFGDFEEAKALWTGVNDVVSGFVDSLSDARNNLLLVWKQNGGRTALLQSFVNILNAIDAVLRPIGQAFREVFGYLSGSKIAAMTKNFSVLLENLILTKEQMQKIHDAAVVTFTVFKRLINLLWEFRGPIVGVWSLVKAFTTMKVLLAGGLGLGTIVGLLKMAALAMIAIHSLDVSGKLGNIQNILTSIASNPFFKQIKAFFGTGLVVGLNLIGQLYNYLKNTSFFKIISKNLSEIKNIILDIFSNGISLDKVKQIGITIRDLFFSVIEWALTGISSITTFFNETKSGAEAVVTSIKKVEEPLSKSTGIIDTLTTQFGKLTSSFTMTAYAAGEVEKRVYNVETGLVTTVSAVEDFKDEVEETVEPVSRWKMMLQDLLNRIEDINPVFAPLVNNVKAFVDGLGSMGPVGDRVLNLLTEFAEKINWSKTIAFGVLIFYTNAIKNFNKGIDKLGESVNIFGQKFEAIFGGIGSITESIKSVANGLVDLTGVYRDYVKAMTEQYQKVNFKNTAIGILALAGAFALLGAAVHYLNPDELKLAAAALGVLAGAVIVINFAFAAMSKFVNPIGMTALAGAFVIFTLSLLTLTIALDTVAVKLLVLGKVFGDVNKALIFIAKAFGVVVATIGVVWVALWAFAGLISSIGESWMTILKGVGVIIAMSVALVAFNAALISIEATIVALSPMIAGIVIGLKTLFSSLTDFVGSIIRVLADGDIVDAFMSILHVVGPFIATIAVLKIAAMSMVFIGKDMALAGVLMGTGMIGFGAGLAVMAAGLAAIAPVVAGIIAALTTLYLGIQTFISGILSFSLNIQNVGKAIEWFLSNLATAVIFVAGSIITFGAVLGALMLVNAMVGKIGSSLLKIALGVAALGFAIKIFADIPIDQLMNGIGGIMRVLLSLSLALVILNGVDIGHIAAAILGLVAALYLLTPLAALYGLAWKTLGLGLLIIAGGILAIAGAVKLMEKADVKKIAGIAIVMGALIVGLGYVATLLGAEFKENAEGMKQAFWALIETLLVFAGASLIITKAVESMKSVAKLFAVVVGFGIVVSGLVVALSYLSTLDANSLKASADALSMVMIAFAGAVGILAIITNILKDADWGDVLQLSLLMGVFAASLVAVSYSLQQIQGVEWGTILAFIVGFAGAVALLTVVMAKLGGEALVGIPIMLTIAAVALSMGIYLKMMGEGVKLMAEALDIALVAIANFLPKFLQFLSGLADLAKRAKDIVSISAAVTKFGKSLLVIAAGMAAAGLAGVVFGAGLLATSVGAVALSAALVLAGLAIKVFADNVKVAIDEIGEPVSEAFEWGTHLIGNFISGMLSGIPVVGDAANAIAEIICKYLKHSVPELGALSGNVEVQSGIDMIKNFAGGMDIGKIFAEISANGVGSTILATIQSYAPMMGDAGRMLMSQLGIGMSEGAKSVTDMSKTLISALDQQKGLTNEQKRQIAKDYVNPALEAEKYLNKRNNDDTFVGGSEAEDKKAQEAIDKFNEYYNAVMELDKKNDTFSIDNFMKKLGLDSEAISKQAEEAMGNIEMPDLDADTEGKSSSTKDSDSEKKKAAERARIHAKYLEYSTKVASQYATVYEGLNDVLGNTTPAQAAQNAIKALADNLYQASLTGNETEEELAEVAHNTEKVFVEMYDNIKSKSKDSFDFFKEFKRGFDDITTSKQLKKNVENQSLTIKEMTEMWQVAAMSGFDNNYLKSLIEEGESGMSKFRSLLSLSQNDLDNFMTAMNQKDSTAESVATIAMSSLAMNLESDKLKELYKKRQEYATKGKRLVDSWKKVETSGIKDTTYSYKMLADAMQALSNQYGVSVEEIQKAAQDLTDGVTMSADDQIESFDKLRQAYYAWTNTYNTESTRMLDSLGTFMTSFDKFNKSSLSDGNTSTESIIKNLKNRQKATQLWLNNINDLAARGFDKEKLAEFVEAGVADSYKTVKTLKNASDEELKSINSYILSGRELAKQASEKYGKSVANATVKGIDETLVGYFEDVLRTIGTKFSFNELAKAAGLQFTNIANAMSGGLIGGLESSTDDITTASENIGKAVDTTTGTYINEQNGYSKSEFFMKGILAGINDYKEPVVTAITDVCTAVAETPDKTWDEHSPSKVSAKSTMFFLLGMVNTLVQNGAMVVDSLESNVTNPLVQTIQSALSSAYDILTSDSSFSPTITPVLDLSNIESGRVMLGSLMSNTGFQVNADIGEIHTPMTNMQAMMAMNGLNAPNQNNPNGTTINKLDDSRIVSELNALRTDVNNLNENMANLQVVMDSGSLVGAIAPKMDDELGSIYRRRNR